MDSEFTDWLGNRVYIGDTVIYPVSVGRSINVALAVVTEMKFDADGILDKVAVKPLEKSGSRWVHATGNRKWRDRRTGKGIYPYSDKHIKERGHYRNTVTHETVSSYPVYKPGYSVGTWEYISSVFNDYVEEYEEEIRHRWIVVTENITKVVMLDGIYRVVVPDGN